MRHPFLYSISDIWKNGLISKQEFDELYSQYYTSNYLKGLEGVELRQTTCFNIIEMLKQKFELACYNDVFVMGSNSV